MILFIIFIFLLIAVSWLFMRQASFGKTPEGVRLERIRKSAHYLNGSFKNLTHTSMKPDDVSYWKITKGILFDGSKRKKPAVPMYVLQPDFHISAQHHPVVTWFGHSSLLLQLAGKNILIDPVFSERTSPVQYAGTKAFTGANIFSVAALPPIDLVIISHDHYDHLDYGTIIQLKNKAKAFYTPLGVGAHLERWGIQSTIIHELDWWEEIAIDDAIKIAATPARHFSGRGFKRNQTLWASFAIITPGYRIFYNGDSGYEQHFKAIGEKYGPFDLAIIETGQYNEMWPDIHMQPEQSVQAAVDVQAKVMMPVHWGKFALALHAWDDPILRATKKAGELQVKIATPEIGGQVIVDSNSMYPNKRWWEKVQ